MTESLRTIVVDDEPLARANLRVLLARESTTSIVAECGSGNEAIAAIRSLRPDLVFLDVEMPDCDGFDVLEQLGRDAPPGIVFVTAYERYALRAFEAGALDYLLKPFDDVRFALALDRAKERIATRHLQAPRCEQFIVKTSGRVVFIRVSEIDWIEAADYYSRLHVGTATYLLRRPLSDLHRELDPAVFSRVHRSAIVKLERIRGLENNASGNLTVVLRNGLSLPLGRHFRRELEERLQVRQTPSTYGS